MAYADNACFSVAVAKTPQRHGFKEAPSPEYVRNSRNLKMESITNESKEWGKDAFAHRFLIFFFFFFFVVVVVQIDVLNLSSEGQQRFCHSSPKACHGPCMHWIPSVWMLGSNLRARLCSSSFSTAILTSVR